MRKKDLKNPRKLENPNSLDYKYTSTFEEHNAEYGISNNYLLLSGKFNNKNKDFSTIKCKEEFLKHKGDESIIKNNQFEEEFIITDVDANYFESNHNSKTSQIGLSQLNEKNSKQLQLNINSDFALLAKRGKLTKPVIREIVLDTNKKVVKAIELLNKKFNDKDAKKDESTNYSSKQKLSNKKGIFFNLIKSSFMSSKQ